MLLLHSTLSDKGSAAAIRYSEYSATFPKDQYPILVTTLKRLHWIVKPTSSLFRVGYQTTTLSELYSDITNAIVHASRVNNWGSVCTTESEARSYLAYFDLSEVEEVTGLWVPKGLRVFAPKDRGLLGQSLSIGPQISALVHNPSRAVAFTYDNTYRAP
jgi:hypothetical protein